MPVENKESKARRYLSEGRIQIRKVDYKAGLILAEARGGDTTYYLGFDPDKKEWRCTCEARGLCAHLIALQLVVERPKGGA